MKISSSWLGYVSQNLKDFLCMIMAAEILIEPWSKMYYLPHQVISQDYLHLWIVHASSSAHGVGAAKDMPSEDAKDARKPDLSSKATVL